MTFRFNKSNSQLASTIEMATDGQRMDSEDWSLFMTICDMVNSTEDGPKEAVKSIKKRFATKHPPTIVLTLSLLESLMKNCGRRMHSVVCTKDFMVDLVKVISPKNNYSISLQNAVLSLIQNWALEFRTQPELKEAVRTYQELKNKGVEFPAVNQDDAIQNFIPSQNPSVIPPRLQHPPRQPQQPSSSTPQPLSLPLPCNTSIPQHKMDKLRGDLAVVRQNAEIFGEMLTAVCDGSEGANSVLLEDLNKTCREMQDRVLILIQKVQVEALTGELLQTNDELNNQFVRYERYIKSTLQQQPKNNNDSNNNYSNNIISKNTPNKTPSAAAAITLIPVDNLIDIDDSNDLNINNNRNNSSSSSSGLVAGALLNEEMGNMSLTSNDFKQNFDPFSPSQNVTDFSNHQNLASMKENELEEMKEWLEENEVHRQASTGEFEKFLEERIKASGSLADQHNKNDKK